MFGNNAGSSWANPQQNQQQPQPQQQGTGLFGQPAGGFGTGGAFGTGSTFGQNPQQQQQQPANPMFGASTSTGATGGFGGGAFGNTANAGTSAFGAPKPATGFGTFGSGGTGTFGTGAFGSNTNTQNSGGGLFGQTTTGTTNAFGSSGGGVFGNKPAATSAFGTPANPSAGPTDSVPPVTTGSSNPPYQVFTEKEPTSSQTLQYQSITCMPQYRGTSFEELRAQDYAQGRKTAGAGAGAFGQPAASGFGTQQPAATTSLFGQPAQNTQQPAASGFGTFGNTNTGSAFGSFGQNTTAPTAGNTFGTFGQPQQPQQPQQQQQQPSGFGTFGQPQQQQQQQQPPTGGGLFGGGAFGANNQNQAKPFGTFGATNTGTSAFGGGLFGQNNQQQQQQQPQQQPSTGASLFGQPQQQTTSLFGGGFGTNSNNNANTNAPKTGLFGQPTQQAQPAGFGTGLFGNTQSQPQQQQGQQQGGLFGGGTAFGQNTQPQNQPAQGGNLFGNTQQTQQPQTGGSLFGNTGGGGLFGNNQQQPANQQQPPTQANSFGLFGQKPAAPAAGGGLFGGGFGQNTANTNAAPQQQTTSLFGAPLGQSTTQPSGFGGGLFGAKPQPQPQQASQPLGGSLFGNSLNASALNTSTTGVGQGSLVASIAQPQAANLPIFSLLPADPSPNLKNYQLAGKKTRFDMSSRSAPRPISYQPGATKLRGYTSLSQSSTINGLNGPLGLFGSRNSGSLTASTANGHAGTFGSGSVLGTGQRNSVKKLVLDRKVNPADLIRRSSTPSSGKPTFVPALVIAARQHDALSAPPQGATPPLSNRSKSRQVVQAPGDGAADLQEGEYWTKPPYSELTEMGYEELSAVPNLVVGRVGFGEVHFLEPVDLTTLVKLADLLGDVVRLDHMECAVYPDSDDVDKPPVGSGLNVKTRISLLRCWPLDKATREPIKDEGHPAVVKHVKRLKNLRDTEFEGFDIETGKWTFTVEHF